MAFGEGEAKRVRGSEGRGSESEGQRADGGREGAWVENDRTSPLVPFVPPPNPRIPS